MTKIIPTTRLITELSRMKSACKIARPAESLFTDVLSTVTRRKHITSLNRKTTAIANTDQCLAVYHLNVLKFLDDLECPLLLLPRIKKASGMHAIAFITDIRFTDISSLRLVVKTARSMGPRWRFLIYLMMTWSKWLLIMPTVILIRQLLPN